MIQAQQFYDSEEYYERLCLRNKIICSFSREADFLAAADAVGAAANYTVQAQPWCSHNDIYLFDEEGYMKKFQIQNYEGAL